jgi:ATP-dependent Lon protease
MFNLPKITDQDGKKTFPAIVIKKMVIFPTEKASLVLQGEKVGDTIDRAHRGDHLLVLLFQKNGENSQVGVLAKVLEHWNLAPDVIGLIIEGLRRVEIERDYLEDGNKLVDVTEIVTEETLNEAEAAKIEALSRKAFDQFKKILQAEGSVPLTIIEDLQQENLPPERVSDIIASSLKLEFSDRLALLEKTNVRERLELLNSKLTSEIQVAQAEKEIQDQVNKELEQSQKELLLREKLKAIEKELGIYEEQKEYDQLEQKIDNAGLPKEAEEKIRGELRRLRQMSAGSAEVPYIRNYLEWVTDLPWNKKSEVQVDLDRAREVLDEDHFGLEKPKERVLEYLAVQKLTSGKGRGTILCFVGPPGTGKTSVGQSIARAVGREFVRISLGGVRDEAEIRGHRRTYVGALPGRIIQGIRNAKTKNPVFMMDEIDKLGMDFHGDPSAALLEVLDPAQNFSFTDHYIDIPFDLSEVFFITTANILDPIPPALQDRMEVIEFPGYTDEEKFHIVQKYLIPRVLKETGLVEKGLTFQDGAIEGVVRSYTREAGVRELERKLAEVSRKIAMKVAKGESDGPVVISKEDLINYLGPEEYEPETREEKDEIGVATGLAWTPTGGEIIFIETNLVPGKGNLTLTGQLGEIMQESARAALSYVRSRSKQYHFNEEFYYESDIHVHVPSGAIPKDGPSAGVAIATALTSMLTGKKIKKEVALTGEVTLSGKVLKVGGVKEKVLAAHRAGIKTIIMPKENEKNLVDVPDEVKRDLEFKFVKHMDEVPKIALA